MKPARRHFLKSLAYAGGSLSLLAGSWREALAGSTGYPRLLHGPLPGAVSADSIQLWMRASGRYPVSVRYGQRPDLSDARQSEIAQAGPGDDFVARIALTGLQPGTTYYYRPWVDGKPAKYLDNVPPFQFTTAPAGPARFRLGFGSCARWQEFPQQPIWHALDRWEPDLFCWLGDNIYADTVEPGIMSDLYKIQRAVPEYQRFGNRVPQLAIWDDHDYGLNNSDVNNPMREESLALFKRYWANPGYGTAQTPGVFFQYHYGGVDFFFLDNRYHRDPNEQPDGPGKSQLGAGQLAWLKAGLKASRAPFKLLICGGGWSHNPAAFGEDNWTSYRHERDGLFDFIRDEEIGGVILMSGDVHRAEANCIPRSGEAGYDLYEFVSSGLAQDTPIPESIEVPEIRLREPFTGGHNAGIVDFDLTLDDPQVRFNVVNAGAQSVWDEPVTVRASELRNGVSSWRQKVDPELPSPRRDDINA
ncbi:alkaline phosphatase D family protein [Parahaliea mediterranea]|uniref:alkaline phosphatase D family protein n=1 Tax=Parahaliea mediterranea TaxID=651086 RepID=UPI000E2F378E|nr:alkaline phosphatase D family protein [Parahaliea mediterranea]